MNTPVMMYERGCEPAEINDYFKKNFVPLVDIILPASRPVLFAGGEVLRLFYQDGKCTSSDLDVFIPVYNSNYQHRTEKIMKEYMHELISYDKTRVTVIKPIKEYAFVGGMTALGLKEKSGRRVDVVFVDTMLDPLHMTHADLQEVLQVRFDIKICSMAWSGSELYFPCMEREGIINKITWVCDIGRVSGPQYSRYDVLMQRLEKYRERGFKFIFEEDWKDFGFGTRDKL